MLEAFDSGVLDGIAAGIGADLAVAAASGSPTFAVDLQALYDYYFKVKGVLDDFHKKIVNLPESPYDSACVATSEIPGVADSMQATMDNALGMQQDSMKQALAVVQAKLARHLNALADIYKAYVRVDSEKSSELTAAGNPKAAKINLPGTTDPLKALEIFI